MEDDGDLSEQCVEVVLTEAESRLQDVPRHGNHLTPEVREVSGHLLKQLEGTRLGVINLVKFKLS